MGSRPSLLQRSAEAVKSDGSSTKIAKISTPAVGKTTLFRQFRFCGKCKPLERRFYCNVLLQNVVQIFSDIFQACKELNLDISKQKFFDNIERITASDYVPTEIDILNSYAPTIGIDQIQYHTSFASINIVDIGGSAYFRRKWDKFYSIINVLIYIVDLTAFCKHRKKSLSSEEDECVTIFTQLCNNFTLKKSHFIVLFNKKDVFDAQKRPQINGPPPGGADATLATDSTSSLSLIKAKFLNQLPRKIYQHTVSLLHRDTFEASVMDSISKIAAKNRAVAPM
ncbi:BMA-GPA-18 [Dirofilaria immitis]|nr:BMA-GPA-18 [Dirofilaria immitis]